MKHRKIRNVMTTDVATVDESAPFKDIVALLDQRRISAVPVLDPAGRVIGVVSQADLLPTQGAQEPAESRWSRHRHVPDEARGTTAGELMTTPAITIGPDATVVDAAKLLDRHAIKRLPVVDPSGRLVGIVSRRDLLGVFLRTDNAIAEEIARDVFERNLDTVVNPATVTIQVHDGMVSLHGQLQRRSMVPIAEALTRRVDGVIDVHSELTYAYDDTHLHIPDAMAVDITHEN
ncbi:CBS domain-containing protein [Actinophytocola sp.]|uniref:CBS domain-containing protein n=1 Tax=Actinophytocola sp. TaxID=1872138 RepID=UPI002D7F9C94|nr:CBS domain-containing protein [Actinophytocola sp.]HET9138127.1 CBS domain-containing protein [Actinophytocola sp.]